MSLVSFRVLVSFHFFWIELTVTTVVFLFVLSRVPGFPNLTLVYWSLDLRDLKCILRVEFFEFTFFAASNGRMKWTRVKTVTMVPGIVLRAKQKNTRRSKQFWAMKNARNKYRAWLEDTVNSEAFYYNIVTRQEGVLQLLFKGLRIGHPVHDYSARVLRLLLILHSALVILFYDVHIHARW